MNDREVLRMIGIINSMTKKERRHGPAERLAPGARGARLRCPADVNRLLKQYQQMEKMMAKTAAAASEPDAPDEGQMGELWVGADFPVNQG